MRFLLFALSFAALPALAQADDCNTVRRALQLARQSNIDAGDLGRLERQLCQVPMAGGGGGGSTCQELDAFWMLAVALGETEEAGALEAQRGIWCARGDDPVRALQWPNGSVLRNTSGTLNWPNGGMARSTSGSWYAPSGAMLKSSAGTVYYPSGSIFRSTSGRSHLPSGDQADEGRIAALACQADQSWCRYFLGEVRVSVGARRDFAMLGLGLLAGR